MYQEIQQSKGLSLNKSQVARKHKTNRRTVGKYWEVTPDEFAQLRIKSRCKTESSVPKRSRTSIAKASDYCAERRLFSAVEFRTAVEYFEAQEKHKAPVTPEPTCIPLACRVKTEVRKVFALCTTRSLKKPAYRNFRKT